MTKIKMRLSASEVCAIEAHNNILIEACEKGIRKYSEIPANKRPLFVVEEIRYWQNVKKALRWSTAIAKQRQRRQETNANATPLADSGNACSESGIDGRVSTDKGEDSIGDWEIDL